jgi:preprotein translocase subunit SecA
MVRIDLERMVKRTLESELAAIERLLEAATIAYEGAELDLEASGQVLNATSASRAVSRTTGLEIRAQDIMADEGDTLQGRDLERAILDRVHLLGRAQVRTRMLAHIQARLGGQWTVPSELLIADIETEADERALVDALLVAVDEVMVPQIDKLAAEIASEIDNSIRRPEDCTRQSLTHFLYNVRFGSRTGYDKSHRRVSQRVERFGFIPWAARKLASWDPDTVEQRILEHLGKALTAWENDWAQAESRRVSANTLGDLDQETQTGLQAILGEKRFAALKEVRVSELSAEDADVIQRYLGERVLFNVQRQLMLDITSRYWVEHLTEMEVLRQGIGLQSYAQKDPLAEYKVRAYDMFQELLRAIQSEVVTAMFTYRPRDLSQVRVGVDRRRPAQGTALNQSKDSKRTGNIRPRSQKSSSAKKKTRRRRKKR